MPTHRLLARLFQRPHAEWHDEAGLLGERHELHRRYEAAFRMLPADQGLEPGQRAVVQIDHGLVVDAQLPALDGAVQCVSGAQVVDRAVVLARVVELGAVATELLGPVHRGVGVAQQGLGRVGRRTGERDAHAGGHEDLALHQRDRARDRLGQALGHQLGGLLAGDVVAQDHELVAAEPRDDVGRPHRGAQAVGDRDQQPVTGGVAEAVVHHLEPVEVEEQDGDAFVVELGVGELTAEPFHEVQAVRESGQRVVDRLVRQRVTAGLARRRCPRPGSPGTAVDR